MPISASIRVLMILDFSQRERARPFATFKTQRGPNVAGSAIGEVGENATDANFLVLSFLARAKETSRRR